MKLFLLITTLLILTGCDSMRTYRIANMQAQKTSMESRPNASILNFKGYTVQIYTVRFNFELGVELMIQSKSNSSILYTLNQVSLRDKLKNDNRLVESKVIKCNSKDKREAKSLKINPGECYSVWYTFNAKKILGATHIQDKDNGTLLIFNDNGFGEAIKLELQRVE